MFYLPSQSYSLLRDFDSLDPRLRCCKGHVPLTLPFLLPDIVVVLDLERQDPSSFQPLPFHYQEVAYCLFTAGTQESLPKEVFGDEQGRVRDLVNLVQKTRYNKILQGLGMMQEAAAVKLNNLSAMELNSVRAFFTGALDQFYRYSRIGDDTQSVAVGQQGTGTDTQQPARQLRQTG